MIDNHILSLPTHLNIRYFSYHTTYGINNINHHNKNTKITVTNKRTSYKSVNPLPSKEKNMRFQPVERQTDRQADMTHQ